MKPVLVLTIVALALTSSVAEARGSPGDKRGPARAPTPGEVEEGEAAAAQNSGNSASSSCGPDCQQRWKLVRDGATGLFILMLVFVCAL